VHALPEDPRSHLILDGLGLDFEARGKLLDGQSSDGLGSSK
jgi:hypothetical protein